MNPAARTIFFVADHRRSAFLKRLEGATHISLNADLPLKEKVLAKTTPIDSEPGAIVVISFSIVLNTAYDQSVNRHSEAASCEEDERYRCQLRRHSAHRVVHRRRALRVAVRWRDARLEILSEPLVAKHRTPTPMQRCSLPTKVGCYRVFFDKLGVHSKENPS